MDDLVLNQLNRSQEGSLFIMFGFLAVAEDKQQCVKRLARVTGRQT